MNAVSTIEPVLRDDILLAMPEIEPDSEEHKARAKLRSYRNAATALVNSTESANARSLAWLIIEISTNWLYAAADEATLIEINRHANRLLITAVHAEQLHDEGIAA